MLQTPLQHAIRNNAYWCDTLCAAHALPGEFDEDLWCNAHQVPRFYPNVVTLTAERGVLRQYAAIHDLVTTLELGSLSVKDSFNILDLTPFGLQSLFEATWLWRSPDLARLPAPADVHYTMVQTTAELALWEQMWSRSPTDGSAPQPARLFLPSLLSNPAIAIVAAYQQQHLVGGAITYRTGDVVGVSNIVFPQNDPERWWVGFLAAIVDLFPGLALVGYEQGDDLKIAQSLGFEAVGSLRVWAYSDGQHR